MSNRFLSVLILLWFIWVWYIYYHMEYLPAKQKQIVKEQLEKKEQSKKIELTKKEVELKKITTTEKIEELKQKQKNYKTFDLSNSKSAYFKEKKNNLDLFLGNEKIGTFDMVYEKYLRVEDILATDSSLYIEVWDSKFYYNDKTKQVSELNFWLDVDYVKKIREDKLVFVTQKWSFNYFISSNTFNYFSFFNDFVYFADWYVWLIKKSDTVIIKNLWLKNIDDNILFYYNPLTKEKKTIYTTDLEIKKIYVENNKLYLVTTEGDLYELENIKNNLIF